MTSICTAALAQLITANTLGQTSQQIVGDDRRSVVPIFAVAEGEALHDDVAADLLPDLAESTGGRMYKTNHLKESESVFRAIGRYLRNGYLPAFQAPSEAKTTYWHELQVLIKNTSEPLKVTADGLFD